MKVTIYSDLHLEFGPFSPHEGEVLILAGDICCVDDIYQTDDKSVGMRYKRFFKECADNYDKVYYVMGNHEHYNYDIDRSVNTLGECIDSRIHILDEHSHEYNGITFIGTTLWTDMGGGYPSIISRAQEYMNDYTIINKGDRALTPMDTMKLHRDSLDWLEGVLDTSERVFMVSHHAPSPRSLDERSRYMVEGYCSDLDDFIIKYPQIEYWAHGHIHKTNDYMIGQCRVLSNPRGYYNNGENRKFNREMVVTVL